jgi:hypothetical protein
VELPLLLAGPILRRVETTLATVWVALSKPATVKLRVWEGSVSAGADHDFVVSSKDGEQTKRIGDKLHLGLLTARIPAASGKGFQPDKLYSYDVEITVGGTTENLKSLHMLDPEIVGEMVNHVPLGYTPGRLPTFAPPPAELVDLRILYGSCRSPSWEGPDAMVWIDDLLAGGDLYLQPSHRPHQLFLGGDQIYADSVAALQMLRTMQLGQELIGTKDGHPVEHITLDKFQAKVATTVDPKDPAKAYADESPSATSADSTLPIERRYFPEGHRLELTRRGAQFTSEDGKSHLISLGEFAATYLCAWSNACWGNEIPGATLTPDANAHPTVTKPLEWSDEVGKHAVITLPDLEFPARIPKDLLVKPEVLTQKELRASHQVHREFLQGLPKVQRALANIPTYMMLDDHDVTDDYFLNPVWRDRVFTTSLGHTILTNAMLAYALFQDWGNNPVRYDSGFPAELLSRARDLFPEGAPTGPAKEAFKRLEELFAHDQPNPQGANLQFESVTPPMTWHFTIDGPAHRVIALDNRTRRSYPSRIGPPGNVSTDAQVDQIPVPPAPPLPPGYQVLVVIAPLQVIGPPVLDELVAPLSYRVFDLMEAGSSESDLHPDSPTGLREMVGTNPDAIEAWAFDAVVFEHLLKRLATYQRVVLLSGDVHNSSGSLMSYWRSGATQPVRIVQFTSSGFKNVMPAKISATDRTAGFAQQMVRANLGTERIGWDQPLDDLVLLPTGKSELDLVPIMRSRLQSVPVMVPTWGWPDDNPDANGEVKPELTSRLNPDRPPDWRWRIMPLLDKRADDERPKPIQPLLIDAAAIKADLADPSTAVKGYQAIAARHQNALGRMRNARQILFATNFGLCRFEPQDDGTLDAIHEVYTAARAPDDPVDRDPEADMYLVQRAPLGPVHEDAPSVLRTKVIAPVVPEPNPPEPATP